MFLRKAALRPVPRWAIVDEDVIASVEASLEDDEKNLQESLDRGYSDLDRLQPTIALWMADELSRMRDELVQSVGYFLSVTVYLAFREAFPTRLREVDEGMLQIAEATLTADEELRAEDPLEILDSDDVLAISQPSLVAYVQHHVGEALDQGEGEVDLDELDRVYRALLVQVIALSHAVASPTGELGPSREALA
ncbi:MAG: hypothetical protein JJ863_38210 [Deltaproteobacteria bacterium]|nr:hypothetical protein [Deltaproteobacteria bacterium]